MCAHVVVAEDDGQQAELIRRYLESELHVVDVVGDGRSAVTAVRAGRPDLVVLDLMLPQMSGLDACRVIRQESGVAVLMLTARSTEDDVVLGLDVGANDYVTKPYSPRELMARVRSLLRRSTAGGPPDDGCLRVGAIRVDPVRHEVSVAGRLVETTPGEFRLLEVMASHPERTLTRSQLLAQMHGLDAYVTSRTIDVHVMNLRRKIEVNPSEPLQLLTVYGVGYRLTAGRVDTDHGA